MPTTARRILRALTVVLAAIFLLSASLNLGAKIPLGFATLSFSSPLGMIADFEILIGAALLVAAAFSRLYAYAGGYLLGVVGIVEGLVSSDVQGLARDLHETMIPFAVVGCIMLAIDARSAYKAKGTLTPNEKNRGMILILQFFVGALITLGGAAFAASGTYPVGTVLGLIHFAIGIAGLYGGYSFLKRGSNSRQLLITLNILTIVYSIFSESLAEIYAYLPPGIGDALIGTIIAIIVSAAIIYLLQSSKSRIVQIQRDPGN
jgi:hypothetical protein